MSSSYLRPSGHESFFFSTMSHSITAEAGIHLIIARTILSADIVLQYPISCEQNPFQTLKLRKTH